MANNKKKDAAPLLIFYGFIILLAIFSIIATLFILISWIACELIYARYSRTPDKDSIVLDADETLHLKETSKNIIAIENRLETIEQEGANLRRRKDGLFHAGSTLGAKLNEEIAHLLSDLNDLKAMRHELHELPQQRLREWCAPLCRLIAFRWAVAIYILAFLFGIKFQSKSVIFLNNWITHLLSDYLPSFSSPIYGVLAIASIMGSLALFIAFIFYGKIIYNHYSKQFFSPQLN